MCRYNIEINTRPIPKARPRLSKFTVYTPKKTIDYEKIIAFEWKKKYKDLVLKNDLFKKIKRQVGMVDNENKKVFKRVTKRKNVVL